MRVLHIVEAFGGGVVTFLQALINGSDEQDEHIILYARRDNTPDAPEKLFRPGTRLIRSENLSRELRPGEDIAAFFEIRRVVKEVRPDIVHLHSSKAGALGRWAINGKKLPLFYTPHGYSFLMDGCGEMKRRMYFLFEKVCGYRRCTTVACGKGECEQGKRVTKDITYVSNGINAQEVDALVPDIAARSDGVNVCTLARISRQKDPERFNEIAEAFPDVKFTWIGDGELREVLTSPNIEVTGWLPREEALRKVTESAVFLLPSRWEGLSLSLLEAMYLRRLCIVSRIPGNVDVIENRRTGYVCERMEDYVEVIQHLMDDGIDSRMTDAAHERVATELNQTVMVRKYGELYKKAMKTMGGGTTPN